VTWVYIATVVWVVLVAVVVGSLLNIAHLTGKQQDDTGRIPEPAGPPPLEDASPASVSGVAHDHQARTKAAQAG
jgi:hypothetical protein